MPRNHRSFFYALLLLLVPVLSVPAQDEDILTPAFAFEELPPLPENIEGFFLGQANGTVIAAGGESVDGDTPHSQIYALVPGSGVWSPMGELPTARSHGATASAGGYIVLVGGLTEGTPNSSVLTLTLQGNRVDVASLPNLPVVLDRPGATVQGGNLYVAGSTLASEGTPESFFLRLDLRKPENGWTELPAWPGAPRVAPTVAFSFESVHILGGLVDGVPTTEGFAWHPIYGWRTLAPAPSWGAYTRAASIGESHIFVFEGADAAGDTNPQIIAYHTLTDSWVVAGEWTEEAPGRPAAVSIGDRIIVVSGQAAAAVTVLPPANNYGWVDHIVVALYLVAMLGMGAWFIRRERNTKDYFRAGNNVPWWALGMSLFATAASAISLMTMPGKSYGTDWTYFSISIFSVMCLPLSMFVLAPLVRKLNISTANEYLELRFGLVARMVGSLIYIINQILARMAPIIFLPSIAMSAITGIDIWIWIVVVGSVTTLYTFLGGLSAVIWTDTIQGLIMLATVAGCLVLIVLKIDLPLDQIWPTLQENNKLRTFDWKLDITYPTVWMVFIGTVFTTLLGIGDQNYVQRVQAAPTLVDAKKAIGTQMAVAIPINVLLFALGTALYLYYRSHPGELNPVMKTDGIYPLFAAQHLPPGVSGLVIAALLAASMSTISSAINSVANIGIDDFYRRFNRNVTERSTMRLSYILSLIVGVCGILGALYLSLSDSTSVWDTALLITGLITNGTVGFFGLGLLTKRAHQLGTLLGVLAGMSVVFWLQQYTPVTFWLYAVVGSIVTFVVGYVLSLILPGKPNNLDGLTVFTLDKPRAQL